MRALGFGLALVLFVGLERAPAFATNNPAGGERLLAELPAPPALELAQPGPSDLADVDALLGRVLGEDAGERENAVRELLEVTPRHVSAIRFRLSALGDSANKEAMKQLLLRERRKMLDRKSRKDDEREQSGTGLDYLSWLGAHPEPASSAWRDLTSVLALSRMLESVGDVAAVRGLVDVYARFGEFLRITTQNAFARLGERAVPALIEAERHPAEKISKWAARELDRLGKGIPSEAVQTQDQAVLADVLRAYGRVRDPDAARIITSFANSERGQVREAARQAVALLGEVATWQLRDTYENIVGKKPPRDWGWERTARELFTEFDRLRQAEVGKLFDEGVAARARGDLPAMQRAFDALLARDPAFERKAEVAEGYLAFAVANLDRSRPAAISALRRTERLAAEPNQAASLRLTLEAEALEETGVADTHLLTRALELDPKNTRARAVLARFERGEPQRSEAARFIAPGAVLALAAAAIAFILRSRASRPGAPAEN